MNFAKEYEKSADGRGFELREAASEENESVAAETNSARPRIVKIKVTYSLPSSFAPQPQLWVSRSARVCSAFLKRLAS